MSKRRKRVDGAAGLQQIVSEAVMPCPEPPVELTSQQRVYWELLYKAKAKRGWCTQDLYGLVDAVRLRDEIETLREAIQKLDPVDDLAAYDKLSKLIISCVRQYSQLSAFLQIHPEATQGKSYLQVKQNTIHTQAAGNTAMQHDDLIARPTAH